MCFPEAFLASCKVGVNFWVTKSRTYYHQIKCGWLFKSLHMCQRWPVLQELQPFPSRPSTGCLRRLGRDHIVDRWLLTQGWLNKQKPGGFKLTWYKVLGWDSPKWLKTQPSPWHQVSWMLSKRKRETQLIFSSLPGETKPSFDCGVGALLFLVLLLCKILTSPLLRGWGLWVNGGGRVRVGFSALPDCWFPCKTALSFLLAAVSSCFTFFWCSYAGLSGKTNHLLVPLIQNTLLGLSLRFA